MNIPSPHAFHPNCEQSQLAERWKKVGFDLFLIASCITNNGLTVILWWLGFTRDFCSSSRV